jgi:ABC-type multidrug transport system ATPase subunit
MRVSLVSVFKSFSREHVIRDLSHVFEPGSRTALLGPNGSGKSTLLQLIGGISIPTKGTVTHELDGQLIDPEHVYRHISIAAPYLSLYEELSLREAIMTHSRFKALRGNAGVEDVARIALLENHLEKPVRDFSSGMKQRLKLTLAILSDTSLVVASNRQEVETSLCGAHLEMGS